MFACEITIEWPVASATALEVHVGAVDAGIKRAKAWDRGMCGDGGVVC